MTKKHNPKCPLCGKNKTIKKGSQKGLKRFRCKICNKSFSVDHREKPVFWVSHMDGMPFRKLASLYGISQTTAYRQVEEEMNQLPENTYLSATYCDRWSGILNVDGKFVRVKGYEKKIPFIYSMDFLTHDLPVGVLVPSESYQAFLKAIPFVKSFKLSSTGCNL